MIVLCAGPLVFVKYPCVEREPNVSAALFLPLDAKSRIYLTQLNKKKFSFSSKSKIFAERVED